MFRLYILLAVFLCVSAPVFAQTSIGVVDVFQILNNSSAALSIQKQRETLRKQYLEEVAKTEQELRAEEKTLLEERSSLSQEDFMEKRKAYEEKLLDVRKSTQNKKRTLEETSNTAMDKVREQLYVVVQQIANERGYQLVISNKNVIAGETSLDITQETMQRLNEVLPDVSLGIEDENE